ncbi:hypothetical protein A3D14_01890 [Candidatus Saccharibacteria bacterium RIFCSPHIGHO2_02_FULL_47_12]|nr:MAG: hypothetical protein A3D14_01890 [Candidatus Saccharibacteria bacterium RIFCSPHIGHO2_02_FULL_47_12]
MTHALEALEFDPNAVAQAFFDGSRTTLMTDRTNWQLGDYVIKSPDEIWCIEKGNIARKEGRLYTFVGGVAYSLALNDEVERGTVTPESVRTICDELERIVCISLHKKGTKAGTIEHKRVQAERMINTKIAERKRKGGWVHFLNDLASPPGNYRPGSFV